MARICAGVNGKRCGRIFKPVKPTQYRCERCEPVHRRNADRKAYALRKARGRRTGVTAEYKRNRRIILERNPPCYWGCGRKATTADHYPVAKVDGGSDGLDNLVASCPACNYGRTPRRTSRKGAEG